MTNRRLRGELMRFSIRTSVLALLSCFVVASLQHPAPSGAAQSVELKWLEWWVNEWGPPTHAKLIADFEKANPSIKVTVVDTQYPDMAGKLNAAAAGGENYDVFGTEGSWLSGLNKLGYVENLGPWLAKDPALASSLTSVTPLRLNGKTLAFALYLIPYQFAYNVDTFEEGHIKPPTNWNEFVQVERHLRNKAAGKYGMSMPLSEGGFILTRYFGFRLAQEGGRLFDDNGKVVFNSAQGVAALKWWRDFYSMGLVVPGSLGENQTQMLEFLASAHVATVIDGPF